MPRKPTVPTYRLHKSSGQARVIVKGKHRYLGLYGSPQSHEAYARLIAEQILSTGATQPEPIRHAGFPNLTINELLVRYMEFAGGYYLSGSDGGVFTFPTTGGPPFLGSTGSLMLNKPIVGISG